MMRWMLPLLLTGCGALEKHDALPPPPPDKPARKAGNVSRGRAAPAPITAKGVDAPRTVVFVVLDTVRADHTSLCGYARPTTPNLQTLADKGAVFSCDAYSPAPWTHPSHASFFTGKPVTEHGAIWVSDSAVSINPVTKVRPLEARFDTLAETFAARGYQTVAVSANMIITPTSGLLQGFSTQVVTPSSLGLRGKKLRKQLKQTIAGLDPSRPLFLFVNAYDAHDPYPAIPEGTSWLQAQDRVDLAPNQQDDTLPYFRYVKGLSTDEEAAPFLADVLDGYDFGISEADANLGALVGLLGQAGWLGDDFRIAITSDHGEMLGEHRLLRHGGYLYEGMVNVPFLYFDATAATQPSLPTPMTGLVVHDLLLTGTVPDLPVQATAEKNDHDVLVGINGGAMWSGQDKALCTGTERKRYDLAADPGEDHPTELSADHPLRAPTDALCHRVDALLQRPAPTEQDPDLVEALRQVGYVE